PANRIAKLLASEKDDARLVSELYLAILSRLPTKEELKSGVSALQGTDTDFAQLQNEKKRRQALVDQQEKRLPELQAAWEKTVVRAPEWTILEPREMRSKGGVTFTWQPDQSILVSGANPSPEVYTITAQTDLTGITGVRLEVLTD